MEALELTALIALKDSRRHGRAFNVERREP
jgi:hypothetical protein